MQTRSDVKAGAVILAAVVLGAVILVAAGRWGSLFKKKQTLHVLFSDVQGLKAADPVEVMGLELGKVTAIAVTHYPDPAGLPVAAVEVTAAIEYPETFAKDTKVVVNRTLTGNTVLLVEPGRAEEKLRGDEKIFGVAPVSMTDLANKAGIIAKRLDEFVAEMSDRRLMGSARAALVNLNEASQIAKEVMTSLNRTIPGTEKSLVTSVKNFEQISTSLSQALGGERVGETVANLHSASRSLARVGDNVDKIVEHGREPVGRALANADRATANLKALSREVRWQPWLLLGKPSKVEVRERGIYNAAMELGEGAESLNGTVKELGAFLASAEAKNGAAKIDNAKFNGLVEQVHSSLEKSVSLEQKLLQSLLSASKETAP